MEQQIRIDGMTIEQSKKGTPYNVFHTSIGKIGVFEESVISELSKHIGEEVRVRVEQRANGYKNITAFLGVADNSLPSSPQQQPQQQQQPQRLSSVDVVKVISLNSYEGGKAGNRCKVYFETPEEFEQKYRAIMLKARAVEQELNTDE